MLKGLLCVAPFAGAFVSCAWGRRKPSDPVDAHYGTNWHKWNHESASPFRSSWSGRIGHWWAYDLSTAHVDLNGNPFLVGVFGLACSECGYVSVNRRLDVHEYADEEPSGMWIK